MNLRATLSRFVSKRLAQNESKAIALLAVTNPRTVSNASRMMRRSVRRAIEHLERCNKGHLARNWYESGNPYSDGSRTYLPEVLTDARYDQNQITRREAMRRMRYWEQNSIFVKRGLDVSDQYIIGTHMPVVTSLSELDPTWAEKAETVFHEMCHAAGLNGESMFSMLCVGNRRKKVDGNVLFVQTSRPGTVTIRAGTKHETQLSVLKPCYQIVEAHRIGTPFAMWQEEGSNIFDGIQYGVIQTKLPDGQKVEHKIRTHYWVNDAANVFSVEQGFTKVPVENAYYATQAHRVNEPRGLTDFYAVEPTLALLEDLLKMEMKAQEVQSDIALFITNGAGQMVTPGMQSAISALGVKITTDANNKPVVTTQDIEKVKTVYEKIWGGRVAVGRTGDTMQHQAPVRPAEATLNLWNFLIDSFCSGMSWARLLIFPKSQQKAQGTEVRAEIEAANASFIKEFNLIWKPFIHQAWEYFIGWAIRNDERLKNPPADWKLIDVSHPRSLVVDLGYATAETISFLSAGLIDLHQIAQQFGTTRKKIIAGSVRDVFDIKLACAKAAENPLYKQYGITVDAAEVRSNLGAAAQQLAQAGVAEKSAASQTSEA